MSVVGIKEFEEVVDFGLSIGKAIGTALEDGKFDFTDVFTILPAFMGANAAIQGISDVPAEIADLDDEEYKALVEKFKQGFDLENDDVEVKIEMAFSIGLKIAQLAASFGKKSA
mgnify:CR=1 FL=1